MQGRQRLKKCVVRYSIMMHRIMPGMQLLIMKLDRGFMMPPTMPPTTVFIIFSGVDRVYNSQRNKFDDFFGGDCSDFHFLSFFNIGEQGRGLFVVWGEEV